MFASKQFFVDEQNTCFELFTTNRKKIQTGSVKKVKKTLGKIKKKEIKGVSILFIPGRASLMIFSWCLDRRCGWRPNKVFCRHLLWLCGPSCLACLAWPPSTVASRRSARGARCVQSYGVAVQCNQVHNGATWNERAAR